MITAKSISGYTGIFNNLITSPTDAYGITLYAIMDDRKKELDLILLTPECYDDAYRIIRGCDIESIRIFTPSVAEPYFTNLVNLVTAVKLLKTNTRWVYPVVPIPGDAPFKLLQTVEDFYQNPYEHSIMINYTASGIPGVYDITVREGNETRYFCQNLTAAKLNTLYDDISVDEIHVAYDTAPPEVLTYVSAVAINAKFATKLFAHSFSTLQKYYLATLGGINTVKFIFNDLDLAEVPRREYQDYEKANNMVSMKILLDYVTAYTSDSAIIPAVTDIFNIDFENQLTKTVNLKTELEEAQVETATVVGVITAAGNAKVTVTAAGMTNSPKDITVAVELEDTADLIAGKIRVALAADADVAAKFNVSGTGADVVLTAKAMAEDDGTLNIALIDDTCVGITAAAASVDTNAGGCRGKSFSLTNIPAARAKLCIELLYNAAGVITWFDGITWQTGAEPVLAAGKFYKLEFLTLDGGTGWYGDCTAW